MPTKMTAPQVAEATSRLHDWRPNGDQSLSRTFKFSDHITAMGFVVRVAMVAEVMNHHPDLRIVYSTVDITLSTHDAGGVTENDVALAQRIDALAS